MPKTKGTSQRIAKERALLAKEMTEKGFVLQDIADIFGVSRQAIQLMLKKVNSEGVEK